MESTASEKVANAVTQTELVKSTILWQCLYVLRTVSEFQNLAYRVTKTQNDVETLVVYREGVLGIFGPPIDPITLTLDPKGRCVLSVLFKPAQRVSIVSPRSGHIEVASLLAVLRMIAGNGYLFCPGLPEKFLAGKHQKACGNYVVLHKVPFKRYQSPQCPVYYNTQVSQQKSEKSSLCAICPQCMQAARLIQSLSSSSPHHGGVTIQQPAGLAAQDQSQLDLKNIIKNNTAGSNAIIQAVNSNGAVKAAIPALVNQLSSESDSCRGPVSSESSGSCKFAERKSKVLVNGNGQIHATNGYNSVLKQGASTQKRKDTLLNAELKDRRSLLRNLLQTRSKQKSMGFPHLPTEIIGDKISNGDTYKLLHKFTAGKKRQRNICHFCKKQLSSHTNLLKHLQRHKGFSDSRHKQHREHKPYRNNTGSLSLFRFVSRGLKVSSSVRRKHPIHLTGTSLRLFLKYFDDLIPSHNGVKCSKWKYTSLENNNAMCKVDKQMEAQPESSQSVPCERTENGTHDRKSNLKRTSYRQSSVQTLLEAALVARNGQEDVSNPVISSSSLSSVLGKFQQAAVVSTTPQSLSDSSEVVENDVPRKRSRKRSRPASKRVRSTKQNKSAKDTDTSLSTGPENASVSIDHSLLTNLNLLSTVSIETATRETLVSTRSQIIGSNFSPITASPLITNARDKTDFPSVSNTALVHATLNSSHLAYNNTKSVGIHHQLHNNVSENNTLVKGSEDSELSKNLNLSKCALSILLPRKSTCETGVISSLSSQKHQDKIHPASISPPVPVNFVTVDIGHPVSLFSLAKVGQSKNYSPSSECGAMDLSKPKSSVAVTDIPSSTKKNSDMKTSGMRQNVAKFLEDKDKASNGLMTEAKTVGVSILAHKTSLPINGCTGYKKADLELQDRVFASAHNYKINKDLKNSTQVQAVIASPSRSQKGMKLSALNDEIQCGYKWSGSGGLVKERTQMVRELVSSDVMADFISKSKPSATIASSTHFSSTYTTKPQCPFSQTGLSSVSVKLTQDKSENMASSQHALNFTFGKSYMSVTSKEVSDRHQMSIPSIIIHPSTPVNGSTSTSVDFSEESILRSTLTNLPGTRSPFSGIFPVSKDPHDRSATSSPQKQHHKAKHLTASPSQISLPVKVTSPSSYTISSPSLAAILCQPAASKNEINFLNGINHTLTSSASPTQQNIIDTSVHSPASGCNIKTEPPDSCSPEHDTVIMTLPIKTEKWDYEISETNASRSTNNSPADLIIDIGPDLTTIKGARNILNSETCVVSGAAD